MKTLIGFICLLIVILTSVVGCKRLFKPFRYNIGFRNLGNKDIFVEDVALYESKESSPAIGGELFKGGHMTSGNFFSKPNDKVIIEWRILKEDRPFKREVIIELPDEFTKENGFEITFNIDSNNKKVYVSYHIRLDSGGQKEISSDGTVFDYKNLK